MNVEFLLKENCDTTSMQHTVAQLVDIVAEQIKLETRWIDRVIVADYERFGEAVGYFDKTQIYTNANGLLAAGKTFRKNNEDKVSSSSVIIALPVIENIFNAMARCRDASIQWTADEIRSFYVIYHELGHCLDHSLRPIIHDDGTRRDAQGRRVVDQTIECICKYHFGTLYPELPACVFGAACYANGVREVDQKMNNEFLRTQLPLLLANTRKEPADYGHVFERTAAIFWFILTQHAKYVGSAIGNESLSVKTAEELWEIAAIDEEVAQALNQAEIAMRSAWKQFPQVPDTLRDELFACFHQLTRACGYKLDVRDGRDGIWWDYYIQASVVAGISEA